MPISPLAREEAGVRRDEVTVKFVLPTDAAAAFASRQIDAWASQQSRALPDRQTLLDAVAEQTARFAEQPIPRPPYWIGYRIVPSYLEFWMSKDCRLHDRLIFRRASQSDSWTRTRCYP